MAPRPKRMGTISIIIEKREAQAKRVNDLLSEHADIILARMGLPFKERGVSVIALIIEATTDEVGALTGKLGRLKHVRVKSSII
ncbi:MAG: iron-only hydrogenase system regulator [Desulfovibrionales bacterium]|nr:iron-only hydrogenase system regulator [Desulfovibrionales bacterium]